MALLASIVIKSKNL